MGALLPKAPDTSAQTRQLEQERQEAERRSQQERARRNQELLALRQRKLGRQSLIRNTGAELGVKETLGGGNG